MKKSLLFFILIAGWIPSRAQENSVFFEDAKSLKTTLNIQRARYPLFIDFGPEKTLFPLLKLDSLVDNDGRKMVYTYNESGEILESHHYRPNTTSNNVELYSRFVYSNSINEKSTTTYLWNEATQEFLPYGLRALSIATTQTTESDYLWNPNTLVWDIREEIFTLRNPEEKAIQWYYRKKEANAIFWEAGERWTLVDTSAVLEEIYEAWDTDLANWQYNKKVIHWQDANGDISESITYRWDNNAWEITADSRRETYLYDANGNETAYSLYLRDPSNTIWIGELRSVFTYNAFNDLTSTDRYLYDPATSEWFFQQHQNAYVYTYTPEGRLSEIITSRWLPQQPDLVQDRRNIYSYDIAGNLTNNMQYSWDNDAATWDGVNWKIYTYDLSIPIEDLVLPKFYPVFYEFINYFQNSKLVSLETLLMNDESNEWGPYWMRTYYFSELLTAANEPPAAESLKLFPNPAGDLLTPGANAPRASSYQIIDLNGRVLLDQKWNGEGIDVSRLIPGSYVIRLIEGNRVITGKFIKL